MKNLIHIFSCFFKLGFIAFGGGYSMIPLVERKIVGKYNMMEQKTFTDIVSLSGGLPGAIGLNVAIFIGYTTAGFAGAISGAIASILPCLLIISVLMNLFSNISNMPIVQHAMTGIRPVVVALIIYASIRIGKTAYVSARYGFLTVLSFCLSVFFPALPIPIIVVLGIVSGIFITVIKQKGKT